MIKTKFNEEEFCYFSDHLPTPLHNALREGDIETVKLLIEEEADVNAKCNIHRKRILLFLRSSANPSSRSIYRRTF